jgi:hypothetical protein
VRAYSTMTNETQGLKHYKFVMYKGLQAVSIAYVAYATNTT